MISRAVAETLKSFVPEENVHFEEPMKKHTTFRVGGEADCLVEVENSGQLRKIQHYLRQIELPFFVMGKGSNLLVGDQGYRGVILLVGERMNEIRVDGNRITAQAGALLSQVAGAALEHSLTGFEFASGIPGTIGGGVVMNAGAYGGELCQVVKSVTVLDRECGELELDNDTMEFGYRTSVIKNQPFTVTEVTLELKPGNRDEIKAGMEELGARRREKQPLEYPSAGSVFKRPEGHYAGELIMKSGMRGFRIGGAQVSEKHCGFIINTGEACAADVLDVIREVQARVQETFGVRLETEVVLLGEF